MTTAEAGQQAETVRAQAAGQPASRKPVKETVQRKSASKDRKRVKAPVRKQDILLKLLKRPKGARIQDLQQATGWQAHSIRAALTGLRKQGVQIDHSRTPSGKTVYKAVEG